MASTVIEIEHLYKEYRLGVIGYGTLREDLQTWWASFRGKEDPNSMLFSSDQSKNVPTSDRILALNNINLTIKQGERLGIIGANGAGKTTLLKILSRIASPTSGTAKIKGRVASLIAVGTGFHSELTGRENIYLNGSILGLRKFEIDKRFDEIVDFSGVEQFIDTPVKRYSSGMYVRLGFAVAAHLDPDVLIVDEVLAVGDVEFRKKALGKMKSVSEGEGRTVLFVSHNMQSIQKLCPKCILLEDGLIVKIGESSDVVDQYLQGTGFDDQGDLMRKKEMMKVKQLDGKASFTGLEITDSNGKKRSNFKSGEKVFFRTTFKINEHIDNLIHAIVIYSGKSGQIITNLSQVISDNPLPPNYEGEITIELDTKGLNEGEFPLAFQLCGRGMYRDRDHIPSSIVSPLNIIKKDNEESCAGMIFLNTQFNHRRLN